MSRRLSWALALLLAVVPAAAHAQAGQSNGASNEVPPPAKKPTPPTADDIAKAGETTLEFQNLATETADKFAPDRASRAEIKPLKGKLNEGLDVISYANAASNIYDASQSGNASDLKRAVIREGGAIIIDKCVDAVINTACATTGPGAPGCIIGAQTVKTVGEAAAGKSFGEACMDKYLELTDMPDDFKAVAPTNWKKTRADYVDYISKNPPAQPGQVGCHPGHDEAAHPRGCHDYVNPQ